MLTDCEKKGEQNQPVKRIITQASQREDRISLLPDCLIIQILSRLPDTKYAIRTSTLSKRWQHVWTFVNNLIFICRYEDKTAFFLFVDKTLTQCQSKLNKFEISSYYHYRLKAHVKNWIRYAITRNVQQLYLDLWNMDGGGGDEFSFKDDSFFVNSCFTFLHLAAPVCMFYSIGRICWKNLTHLTISNAALEQHLIANILSGSPLLDTLKLIRCDCCKRLDVTSKSVKNLVFSGSPIQNDESSSSSDDDDDENDGRLVTDIIEINAPYVLSLTIQDEFYLSKVLLLDVSSLVKAKLDYTTSQIEEEDMLKRLILSLRHVKDLQIGISCSKVLSRLEDQGFIF